MPLPDQDKRIALALFAVISSIYFATITGVTSSNDGSHYALVRALVERRSFEISPYMAFTEYQDYALNGDLNFSDRPPGTALLAAPLYALSEIGPQPPVDLPSRHDAGNPRMLYAVATAPLAASTAIVLFYLALRRYFSISQMGAVTASLALALGTTTWKYGSVLYSHAQAALVVWLALYLVLKADHEGGLRWPSAFALGFALGFAPLVEYTHIPFSAITGLYLVFAFWRAAKAGLASPETRPNWLRSLAALVIGGLIPVAFLLIYNAINFGGLFEVSTFHADTERWPQNAGLAADFATPLSEGLPGMLFYSSNDNQGLFLLAPVTLLALLGLVPFFRYSRRHFALIMGLFVVYLLIFSKSTTYNPLTNDGRYLTTFVGLWFVPLAFWLDRYYAASKNDLVHLGRSLLFFGLLFLSVRNQFMHIAFSWNYNLDLSQLRPLATPPDNIATLLGTVFRNAPNLPLLWAGEALCLILVLLVGRWRHVRNITRSEAGLAPE